MIIGMLISGRNKLTLSVAAICILTVGLVPSWENKIEQLTRLPVLGRTFNKISDSHAAPELVALTESPKLTAKSALAYDFQSGSILYTYNFDEKLPVASLTKLLSALIVVESDRLNEVVLIKEEDYKIIGANTGLVLDERILVSELLKAMLIASHNDSTKALARHIGGTEESFVQLMNKRARELGMVNSRFENPIGFDHPNHYSSAQDMVILLKEFFKHSVLSDIVKTKETEISALNLPFKHKLTTTNKLLLEDESVIGVKTGYTNEAKGNLVIRSVNGSADVVTIVLGSDDREGDTRKILDWVYTVYRW